MKMYYIRSHVTGFLSDVDQNFYIWKQNEFTYNLLHVKVAF